MRRTTYMIRHTSEGTFKLYEKPWWSPFYIPIWKYKPFRSFATAEMILERYIGSVAKS